jgi:hypothetical protein
MLNKIFVFACVSIILICIAKLAWSDQIFVDGKVEDAKCSMNSKEEFLKIICVSETHICTIYPETGQSNCKQKGTKNNE